MITRIFAIISSIFFPTYCYLCKKEGSHEESLCTKCCKKLQRAYETPFPYITSIYSFKDSHVKRIIHAIKYFHRKDLLLPFAKDIAEKIIEQEANQSVIIPIPMPRLRVYIRGYNHAEALAQEIAYITHLPLRGDILFRNNYKKKKRQVLMRSRAERLKNQHNAFRVDGSLRGLSCVLIDDVTTTGATLQEARRVLLLHGASSVTAYTIAH